MVKRCNDKSENKNNDENITFKKYKTSDIILIDDEHCIKCDFYDSTDIFTRWYVETKCPFCHTNIIECLGFVSDRKARTSNNKIDLIKFFEHLRNSHNENFISIKNIKSNVKKEIVKFTLVKKVIL